MIFLKQSTSVILKIGPFLDETDGKTAETGLTISQADVRLGKNGGDIAQKNESTSCTHDELGVYNCPINTTDTDTLGVLQLWVHESGALPVWHNYMVMPANVWDSLFGSDKLQVHADEITAGLITAAAIAADAIGASELAADAVAEIADAVWDEASTGHVDAGKAGAQLWTDIDAILEDTGTTLDDLIDTEVAAILAAVDTEVAAIKAKTDLIGTSVAEVGSAMTLADGAITAAKVATGAIDADALASDAVQEIWARTGTITSLSVELLLERIYEMLNNKMIVTESTGNVALRNLADSADIATGNVQDLGATTQRNALSWV